MFDAERKLKIAILHLAFIYSGGGEKLVLAEARGLQERGHKVQIFTPVVDRERCFPDVIGQFPIKALLPQLPFARLGHESFQIVLTCILAPLLAVRLRKFDVIFAANQPSPWIALWVKMLFRVPYVSYLAQPTRFLYLREIDKQTGLTFHKRESESLTVRIMHKAKRFIYWADRISISESARILANGEYIRSVLEQTYQASVVSCPAGVHVAGRNIPYQQRLRGRIRVKKLIIKKPFLLITNRHFSQKRFEYGIFSLATVVSEYPEYALVITGEENEYTSEIKHLVNRLELQDKVLFLGYVSEKDLVKLYTSAACYLYTAPEEDFGMGIIEAMAHSVPVVAWGNAGPVTTIKDGKTGLLAKPFAAFDFTHCVKQLISDQKLAEKLGQEGRNDVRQRFSDNKHVEMMERELMLHVT